MSHASEPRSPQEIIEGAETVPQGGLDAPWAGDGGFGYDEPEASETPRLQLHVSPGVSVQVTPSYQLALAVKGAAPVVVNPSVLFDSVSTAAHWIITHQPVPGSGLPEERS